MTNFLVKNEKKNEENVPKMPQKHYESQAENKLVSKHNKYRTLAYFITNNLYVLLPSLKGKHIITDVFFFFKNV